MAGFWSPFAFSFRRPVLYVPSNMRFFPRLLAAILFVTAACGTEPAGETAAPPPTQASPGSDASASDAIGSTEANEPDARPPVYGRVDAGPLSTSLETVGDSAPDGFAACATRSVPAVRTPLDLFFMLDTSGSMNDLVADGQSKWSQVSAAVAAFTSDPASAGLGMGVQYFPSYAAGIPSSCSRDSQCGAAGPCVTRICDDGSGASCHSDDDCFAASCVPVGTCASDPNTLCTTPGSGCGRDANGFDLGVCQTSTPACANGDSCASADYATPAVGIDSLPGIADAVTQSLASRTPQGGTPTAAALEGALQGASNFAAAHPDHKVVAVLATDGMPNEAAGQSGPLCSTSGTTDAVAVVAAIAASGLAATPSIETFGIGVFTPDDITSGTDALDRIAAAGGTGNPYIISTELADGGGSIESQFVAALNAIRGSTLPCQFQLPALTSASSQIPDYSEVNVELSAAAGGEDAAIATLPYAASSQGCDPASGGWYYDVDPSQGTTGTMPTAIDVCPATCAELQASEASQVEIVLGCHTVVSVR
ncbi:MAG TPA: hypothetical protein VK841_02695 [Polyangiaceae bacterium]|jgi:hypothetical protein|nr:hypothetical protein [Polyangiaceae bacterium]